MIFSPNRSRWRTCWRSSLNMWAANRLAVTPSALSRFISRDQRAILLGQAARLSVEPTPPLPHLWMLLHHVAKLLDQRGVLLV